MGKRFVTIWFRHLKTDWFCRRNPALKNIPFVLTESDHGRIRITAVNDLAEKQGIETGMVVADARALIPSLQVFDDDPLLGNKLLNRLAEWCIRYTNRVAIDLPDGLVLDVTGCAHLWGGEKKYIRDINLRLKNIGYDVRATIADTIGAAWAVAHYGTSIPIIEPGTHSNTLAPLPVAALRLDSLILENLYKLGLRRIGNLINMPRPALQKRFGREMISRLEQALGNEEEIIFPVGFIEPLRERLPCLEPIVTLTGIEIALQRLLEMMCKRLQKENEGLRKVVFNAYRVDGKIEKIDIETHRPSINIKHLFKLFEIKISSIEPALGIELFILEVIRSEKLISKQESLWESVRGLKDDAVSELMDRLSNRFGAHHIHRFVPDEHHWPEKSYKAEYSLTRPLETKWIVERPKPLQLLSKPQCIEVAAPVPDYPPMMFRYKNILHKIKKSDGPERIEREWWIEQGLYRDYYSVEDEEGRRYWLFRSGPYEENDPPKWFLHGFFP